MLLHVHPLKDWPNGAADYKVNRAVLITLNSMLYVIRRLMSAKVLQTLECHTNAVVITQRALGFPSPPRLFWSQHAPASGRSVLL